MSAITWTILTGSSTTAGAIARWLNKASLSSGAGGDADLILQEATGWIYTRLRHWKMLTPPQPSTLTVNQDYFSVPSDMLEPDFIMLAGVPSGSSTFFQQELVQKPINDIYRAWNYDGSGNRVQQQPMVYSFNQTRIQLDSPPNLAYPFVWTYYQQPTALSGSNTTNFLTDFYPRLLRTTCMMMGAEWTKESNQGQYDRTYWAEQSLNELEEAQAQSDRARRATKAAAIYDAVTDGATW